MRLQGIPRVRRGATVLALIVGATTTVTLLDVASVGAATSINVSVATSGVFGYVK